MNNNINNNKPDPFASLLSQSSNIRNNNLNNSQPVVNNNPFAFL